MAQKKQHRCTTPRLYILLICIVFVYSLRVDTLAGHESTDVLLDGYGRPVLTPSLMKARAEKFQDNLMKHYHQVS